MKSFLKAVFFLLFLIPDILTAQPPIPDTIEWVEAPITLNSNYWDILTDGETFFDQNPDHPAHKQFLRWKIFWGARVGTESNPGSFEPAYLAWAQGPVDCDDSTSVIFCDSIFSGANWLPLGPLTRPVKVGFQGSNGIGRIQSIMVDPADSTQNTVYAGAASSGLYRTTNANDSIPDWECLTCDTGFPILGIQSIAIDPTPNPPGESKDIYIATGFDITNFFIYGAGIFKSDDNGETWCNIGDTLLLDSVPTVTFTVAHHPTQENTVYVTKFNELWKSTNGGSTWECIFKPYPGETPPGGSSAPIGFHFLRDVVFHPNNPDTMYVSSDDAGANDGGAELFISFDGGSNWQAGIDFKDMGLHDTIQRMDLAASAILPDRIYASCTIGSQDSLCAISGNDTSRISNLVFSDDFGINWTILGECYVSSWFMNDLEVSPTDTNSIFIGSVRIRDYEAASDDFADTPNGVHVDNRDLGFSIDSTGTPVLYSANDGGISRSFDHGANWQDITGYGLNVASHYGVGVGPGLKRIVAGAIDVTGHSYYRNNWEHLTTVQTDGGDCIVDPYDPDILYCQTWCGNCDYELQKFVEGQGWGEYSDNGALTGNVIDPDNSMEIRPMDFHQSRNLYIGYKQVFRREHDTTSTSTGTAWEQVGTLPGDFKLSAVRVAKSDENFIYIGRGGPGTAKDRKIMVCRNALSASPVWESIFSGSDEDPFDWDAGSILDIAIDPRDHNRLWVSTGRFEGAHRVVFLEYDEQSSTWSWSNNSLGLPIFPVHSLAYQEGSKDILYAGTEVGVYVNFDADDPESPWYCYQEGMPVAIITELNIDYCTNTLVASAFGHGIWYTPLADPGTDRPLEITQNTTWEGDQLLNSDLVVTGGNQLEVTGTVHIANDRKIIVERGARLKIDGGTLTSNCGGLWEGIRIEGDDSEPQSTSLGGPQGVVILNNATIEFARVAVRTLNPYATVPSETEGGVIIADSSIFRNNLTDVDFRPYQNIPFPALGEQYNLSGFTNCDFLTTDYFYTDVEGLNHYTHITMNGVRGINFVNCHFDDQRATKGPSTNILMNGIQSLNSFFLVKARCLDGPTNCTTFDSSYFRQQYIAINAGVYASAQNFVVDRTHFEENHTGVITYDVNLPTVTRSSFDVGGIYDYDSGSLFPASGVILYGGTGYKVQENSFQADITTDNPEPIGTVVIESGEDPNQIYLNKYEGLHCGNLANGLNRGPSEIDGLGYSCNINPDSSQISNQYDFHVPDTSIYYPIVGIRQSQGAQNLAAGNTFTQVPPEDYTHFWNTDFAPVTYYYFDGNPPEVPSEYSPGVLPDENGLENQCQQEFENPPPPTVSDTKKKEEKDRFESADVAYDSLVQVRDSLLDHGNTPALIADIKEAGQGDTSQVMSDLRSGSPYISEPALAEFLDRDDLFSETQLVDILDDNPDVLRSPNFWWLVETKDPAFSTGNLTKLEGTRLDSLTDRSELEAAIAQEKSTRFQSGLVLSNYYLGHADSIWVDSLFHWLDQYPDVNTRYFRAQGALLAGNTTDAIAEMDSIGLLFESGSTEASAHASFKRAIEYATEQLDSSQYITNLLNWHRDSLEAWASDGLTHQGRQSQALLNYADSLQYFPIIVLSESAGIGSLALPERPDEELQEPKRNATQPIVKLQVIPNPVTGEAELQYSFPLDWTSGNLMIADVRGQKLYETTILDNAGAIRLDCTVWPPGVYYVLVNFDNGERVSERFSIVH